MKFVSFLIICIELASFGFGIGPKLLSFRRPIDPLRHESLYMLSQFSLEQQVEEYHRGLVVSVIFVSLLLLRGCTL